MRKTKKPKEDIAETFVGGDSYNPDGYSRNGEVHAEICVISRKKTLRPSVEGIRLSGSEFLISIEKPIEGNKERSRGEIKTDFPTIHQKLVMIRS